jgi:hypothetical protein
MPGGSSARSRSSIDDRPVRCSSAIWAASAEPMPDTSVNRSSATSVSRFPVSASTAAAPRVYARAR